jgi:glycosyltransferase involved in cell wall biosynthesis
VSSASPLVSIITPTFNRATYLPETIESVLSQTYRPLEYIVLDDGSEDDTQAVLESYQDRLVWTTHANVGETRTVNRGFAMAKGAIVAVVNSDDPLLPNAVRRAVEFLESRPEVLVAYPDWLAIDACSNVLRRVRVAEYDYLRMARRFQCVVGPGAFIRRAAVEKLGGRDPRYRYVADLEFWLRLGLLGPFARIPEPLATFRAHPQSTSVALQGHELVDEHIRLARDFFSRPEIPKEVRAVHREAMSWARYYAGLAAGASRALAWSCFLKAVFTHPASCARKWRLLALLLVPRRFHGPVRSAWWRLQSILRRRRSPLDVTVRLSRRSDRTESG